ncbi:MAG: hypothetical protein Kow00128_00250 [Deltaproteobacteria bacterium]
MKIQGATENVPTAKPVPEMMNRTAPDSRKGGETPRPEEPAPGIPAVPDRLVQEIHRYIRETSTAVNYSFDRELEMVITKVLKDETGEVLRQYPPEAMLDLMKRLRELRGILFDERR